MVKLIRLRKGVEEKVENGLLTIYSKWILDDGGAEPGEEVIVADFSGKTIGMGFYEGIGAVGVRILSLGGERPIEEIIERNILNAFFRRRFYPFNSMRVVYADADYLPGLIIDKYNDICVVQSSSVGMDLRLHLIANILRRHNIAKYVYVRNDQRSRLEVGLEIWREWLYKGEDTRTIIDEGDARFIVDIEYGQKTGFYLDQRINRIEVGRLSLGKNILDLYSYTGGFGIHGLINGGVKAVFVEENKHAVELLYENLKLNNVVDKADVYEGRVESFLSEVDDRYDIVVLDPPAFVQERSKIRDGLAKYRNVFRDVVKYVGRGYLFISSCSYFVSPQMLRKKIIEVVLVGMRDFWYLGGMRGAAPDHMYRHVDRSLSYLKAYIILIW